VPLFGHAAHAVTDHPSRKPRPGGRQASITVTAKRRDLRARAASRQAAGRRAAGQHAGRRTVAASGGLHPAGAIQPDVGGAGVFHCDARTLAQLVDDALLHTNLPALPRRDGVEARQALAQLVEVLVKLLVVALELLQALADLRKARNASPSVGYRAVGNCKWSSHLHVDVVEMVIYFNISSDFEHMHRPFHAFCSAAISPFF
jgi:hypothetical protein